MAREGMATAREYGLARTSGSVLAINLAEPLVSLGRWDEAVEVIERALDHFPPRMRAASLWRLSADVALARGDLAAAADLADSIRAVLEGTGFKDERQLPLARLETELGLGQDRPAQALSTVEDALDRFNLQTSPRYAWPLLVAGTRACAAALAARDAELAGKAAALRDRLRTEAGKLEVTGRAQRADQLTFAAEAMRAEPGDPGLAWDAAAPAWDAAAQAWDAVSQPYPQAQALLRSAEAALSGGDHDGGAIRLRRAAALAERLGTPRLSDDIELLARRARIALGRPVVWTASRNAASIASTVM